MSWIPVFVGLIVGLALGGSIEGLKRIPLPALGFFFLGYVVQGLAIKFIDQLGPTMYHFTDMAGLVCILFALLFMVRLPFVWMAVLGVALNVAAMATNGGAMAITPQQVAAAGFNTRDFGGETWVVGGKGVVKPWDQTNLPWLTDWIPGHVGGYYKVFSVGDFLLAIGLGLTIFELVRQEKRQPAERQAVRAA
ncbi:MAG: DUF5317 family protein [Chloroflexi bacterium]|nr:DUF5317 family protein [Chloroflexota bacterium]